jgi:hypothetical protein
VVLWQPKRQPQPREKLPVAFWLIAAPVDDAGGRPGGPALVLPQQFPEPAHQLGGQAAARALPTGHRSGQG